MPKYPSWPTTNQGNIVSGRLKVEVRNRFGGSMDVLSATDQKDASLAELLSGTGEVFNVKSYGAIGDGVADDSAAIQAAIDAAEGAVNTRAGAFVFIPPTSTSYGLGSSIEVPIGVRVVGGGIRSTRLKWIGASSPASAIVTSNLTGQSGDSGGLVFGASLENLRIECEGEAVGIHVAGWNEYCYMRNVEVNNFVTTGFYIAAVTAPNTKRTSNAQFELLRAISSSAGSSHGFRLSGAGLCAFSKLTVDAPSGGSAGCDVGILIEQNSHENVIIAPNLEECDVAIDIGTSTACDSNTIIGPNWSNDTYTAAGQTIGNVTNETIGILVRTGTTTYVILNARNAATRDHAVYDVDRDKSWGSGSRHPIIAAGGGASAFFDLASPAYVQTNLSASTDDLDVSESNSVAVSTSSGSVTLGGLTGGKAGQRVSIFKATSANSLIVEHNEGAGDQDIITNDGADITLTSFGGVELVCNGTNWFVISE